MENTQTPQQEQNSQQLTATQANYSNDQHHTGSDPEYSVVEDMMTEMQLDRRNKAKKDMMAGGFFVLVGTALTFADIGFIFWGAMVFGGIQFFKGVVNYTKKGY